MLDYSIEFLQYFKERHINIESMNISESEIEGVSRFINFGKYD